MSVSSTVYQDLISWARSQLDYETANGHPAVLGQAQRKALLSLHETVKSPQREPEIGSTNWVSLLHREAFNLLQLLLLQFLLPLLRSFPVD
jgi:hypothetical protein